MYQQGSRLPGERASKLGHLDVLNSELVQELVRQFEFPEPQTGDDSGTPWTPFTQKALPLRIIFAVDGSLQIVQSEGLPRREIAFVKTALLRLDPTAIAKLDPEYPHPLALKKMMADSALYHSTVFPLKNVRIPGSKNLDAVRKIIYESIKDPRLEGQPYETLKWLLYRKWSDKPQKSPSFDCPHCAEEVPGLPPNSDTETCPHCLEHLYVTDVVGFHLEMLEDSASQGVASAYMLIHETLLLFSAIRFFWEQNRKLLSDVLFIKDGPLTLRGQYSKLVPTIRDFLEFTKNQGSPINLFGQEKTGAFVDHLMSIERFASPKTKDDQPHYAVLSHQYIREEIQRTPDKANEYGKRTNYGEKVFVKLDPYHSMVLSVPTGQYVQRPDFPTVKEDLIGFDRIMATLPTLVSHRHQGAILPIELANGVASLSSYPSAKVLRVFAGLD